MNMFAKTKASRKHVSKINPAQRTSLNTISTLMPKQKAAQAAVLDVVGALKPQKDPLREVATAFDKIGEAAR
jgi:hypothetical protein